MPNVVAGNTKGLAPSEVRAVAKLFQRSVSPDEIVSLDLAREMVMLGEQLRRRVGVLINRQGRIEEVILGTKEILFLPDLGRYRLGRARLRNLRLIFTDLSNNKEEATIPYDIYTDLERLRFDAVVGLRGGRNRVSMAYAYLIPANGTENATTHTEVVGDLGAYDLDFREFLSSVEQSLAAEVVQLDGDDQVGAVIVGVYDRAEDDPVISQLELRELARTAGVKIADAVIQKRRADPKTYIGKGKLEELVIRCIRVGADMLIFDTELKPSQWRAITNSTDLKVLDRSMLILDIFAQRAQSSEGRLQVELAQLKYNLPRLVDQDSGLSRLSGGIGGRGPGETKLEIGRRRIRDKISELEGRIDKVRSARDFRRTRRRENQLQLVSVVGYTNVGKSTLFNLLTGSTVTAENKLFATLDPSQRRLYLPPAVNSEDTSASENASALEDTGALGDGGVLVNGGIGRTVILSDTVGFIRKLPKELETAFQATLEELYEAALLVHVVDASDGDAVGKYNAVRKILGQMELADAPELVVLNKIDAARPDVVESLKAELSGLAVSAARRIGIGELLKEVDRRLVARSRATVESATQQIET